MIQEDVRHTFDGDTKALHAAFMKVFVLGDTIEYFDGAEHVPTLTFAEGDVMHIYRHRWGSTGQNITTVRRVVG